MSWVNEMIKESRYDGAEIERSLWYHGTGGQKVPAILSNGLVPNPKSKTWDTHANASFGSASKASLGGVYLTQDLMIARISAGNSAKKGETQAIVVIDAQPRTFVMDEDDAAKFRIDAPFESEYLAIDAFMALSLGRNDQLIEYYREKYANLVVASAKRAFVGDREVPTKGPTMDPRLENRLYLMARGGWEVSVKRQVAHCKDDFAWSQGFWRNAADDVRNNFNQDLNERVANGEDRGTAYKSLMKNIIPKIPDPQSSESEFAEYSNTITRLLKPLARPSVSGRTFSVTARSLDPIGFNGSNRIVCIIEYQYSYKIYGDHHDRVKVVYGQIPPKLQKDWESHVGDLVIVDNFKKAKPEESSQEFDAKVASGWNLDAFSPRMSKSATKIAERHPDNVEAKKAALATLPIIQWNGPLFHGSPVSGMVEIVHQGFHTVSHGELNAPLLSVSKNENMLDYYSDGEATSGFVFNAQFDKVLVLDDFHYALSAYEATGDLWEDLVAEHPEAHDQAKALGYDIYDELGMRENELIDNIPADIDAIIIPGFDSPSRNSECEMAVTEFGCSKLMSFISSVYIRGSEYNAEDGIRVLKEIGELTNQGMHIYDAIMKTKEKWGD